MWSECLDTETGCPPVPGECPRRSLGQGNAHESPLSYDDPPGPLGARETCAIGGIASVVLRISTRPGPKGPENTTHARCCGRSRRKTRHRKRWSSTLGNEF